MVYRVSVDALRTRLQRENSRLDIHCHKPGTRRRCTVVLKERTGTGVSNLSQSLLTTELEEWVNGYVACKQKRDQ